LLGMEQLAISSSTNFIDYGWLQVDKNRAGNMLSSSSLAEESVEGVIANADGLVGWHLAIGLDPMFQTVQLPTRVSNLDSSLPNMDRDTLTHF